MHISYAFCISMTNKSIQITRFLFDKTSVRDFHIEEFSKNPCKSTTAVPVPVDEKEILVFL